MAVPIRKREGGSGAGRRADTGGPPLQKGVEPASGRDRGALLSAALCSSA